MGASPDELGSWQLDVTHEVDCLEALKGLDSDSLDVVVTSPPYWSQRGADGLGAEHDPREYLKRLVAILEEAMRCLKPSATLWLNLGDAYNTPINWRYEDHVYSSLGKAREGHKENNSAYTKNRGRRRAYIDKNVAWLQYGNLLAIPQRVVLALEDAGYLFRGEVIWYKSRAMPEGLCRRPHRRHEGVYIFAKDEGHRFRTRPPVPSVWQLSQAPNRTKHCSTFPIDLPVRCIEAADPEGTAIICDPFMGSGTTGEAALRLGHRFLGFELDSKACALANERTSEVQEELKSIASIES